MGSPQRVGPSNLRRSEENKDTMLGSSAVMEPCIAASRSKNEQKKEEKKNASSPNKGRTISEGRTKGALLSPNVSINLGASGGSSQPSPLKAHLALHDGLSNSSSSFSSDKTPLHSAASSRTRRPFFLSRLSNSVGSKQRRGVKQRQKEQRRQQHNQYQPIIAEGRHPEESIGGNESSMVNRSNPLGVGERLVSPASTVQTTKSNASGGKRRRGKPAIRFLKRALSSPPILLQRFHSNQIQRRDSSEGSWQDTSTNSNIINNNTSRRRLLPSSSSSSSNSSAELNLAERTMVVPKAFSPMSSKKVEKKKSHNETAKFQKDHNDDDNKAQNEAMAVNKAHCTATSILHHTYLPVLENLCGVPHPDTLHNNSRHNSDLDKRLLLPQYNGPDDIRNFHYTHLPENNNTSYDASCLSIPEDPTVQESIECIFASQLEDGLNLWDEEYDDDDSDGDNNSGGRSGDHSNEPSGHRSFGTLEQVRTSSRDGLISPAAFQQSRMNRKDRKDSSKSLFHNMSQTKKRYEQASMVYVGTFDPSTPNNRVPSSCSNSSYAKSRSNVDGSSLHDTPHDGHCLLDASTVYSNLPADPLPCACATSFLPSVKPRDWPQAPIALMPTPRSGTKIKAIRFSNSSEPLWVPGSHLTWSQRLEEHWGNETEQEQRRKRDQQPHYACCEHCVLLPINNGNEAEGESLVIDFESELFEGTFLLRLRYSEGTTPQPYNDETGYFQGMNRRYQACIRGRFKKALPFTELTTGFKVERKFGKLPSKWVLKGALKVVSFFAPQLSIKLEGVEKPYSITPLGSTPQCINVDDEDDDNEYNINSGYYHHHRHNAIHYQPKELSAYNGDGDNSSSSSGEDKPSKPYVNTIEYSNMKMNSLEGIRVESSEARRSLLGIGVEAENITSMQRAKMRKKAFDKLYTQKSPYPMTDPSKIYTFEFLQHMMNFQDFSIELGNMMGSLKLEDMLDGQPLPIMACHGDQTLWSFDVWNECLWKQALKHDSIERQKLQQQQSGAAASP